MIENYGHFFQYLISGKESYCVRAYAEALEIIPYTLAENAGLHAIAMVTELRNRHAQGELTTGAICYYHSLF